MFVIVCHILYTCRSCSRCWSYAFISSMVLVSLWVLVSTVRTVGAWGHLSCILATWTLAVAAPWTTETLGLRSCAWQRFQTGFGWLGNIVICCRNPINNHQACLETTFWKLVKCDSDQVQRHVRFFRFVFWLVSRFWHEFYGWHCFATVVTVV